MSEGIPVLDIAVYHFPVYFRLKKETILMAIFANITFLRAQSNYEYFNEAEEYQIRNYHLYGSFVFSFHCFSGIRSGRDEA
ncbi:MAG: hypothetical protein MZV63_05780 [Marinilabiliales bacterium]|nr:hypothetical protein [Marinilabiliales bacterium]